MRIAVMGAGIIGVTTAYELAQDGHQVTVFERRGSVAAETSFANAGVSSPGVHLFDRRAPQQVGLWQRGSTWHWLWRWWRAHRSPTCHTARDRLARYSQERSQQLTHTLQLDFERATGHLVLLRTAQDAALAAHEVDLLKQAGTRFEMLDAAGCRRVEPGLSADTELHAGIHLAHNEVGNCRQFAMLLREEAERLGATFRFHTHVQAIQPGASPGLTTLFAPMEESTWLSADTQRPDGASATSTPPVEPETESFDAVVVCAALGAADVLSPLRIKLPFAAVHGYSVTAPLRHLDAYPDLGPRAGVQDARHQVNISRIGSRVRVTGGAELGGSLQHHREATLATLYRALNDWFPGAAHMSQAQVWKGARPTLPDGLPVLGASGAPGIWLNVGHGNAGWAHACGCARVLADSVAGREPAIDLAGLGMGRFHA